MLRSEYNFPLLGFLGFKGEEFIRSSKAALASAIRYPPTVVLYQGNGAASEPRELLPGLLAIQAQLPLTEVSSLGPELTRAVSLGQRFGVLPNNCSLFVRGSVNFQHDAIQGLNCTCPGLNRSKELKSPSDILEASSFILESQHSEYFRWYLRASGIKLSTPPLGAVLLSPMKRNKVVFGSALYDGTRLVIKETIRAQHGVVVSHIQNLQVSDVQLKGATNDLLKYVRVASTEFRAPCLEVEFCTDLDSLEILQARVMPGRGRRGGPCISHSYGEFQGQLVTEEMFLSLRNSNCHNYHVIVNFNSSSLDLAASRVDRIQQVAEIAGLRIGIIARYEEAFFNWHFPSALFEAKGINFVAQLSASEVDKLMTGGEYRLRSDGLTLFSERLR